LKNNYNFNSKTMRNTAVLMVCAYLQGALAAKIFAESETG
jgi:hypothetical protein